MKRILFILVFIIQFSTLANAASWYVDPKATGSNSGTSWSNAWTSFGSIVWGSSGVKAGDTLYLSGGTTSQTYTSTLTIGASGSSGIPISIRVGQDSGHNGSVIFDFNSLGDSGTGSGIYLPNKSYIVIDGSVSGQRKLTIKNLRNTSIRTEANAINGGGSSYITVQYVNIDNCNNGFYTTYGTGLNANNNSFTNIRGDAVIRWNASTGGWDANLIYDNYIGIAWNNSDSTHAGPDGVQSGHGCSIYNNTFKVDKVSFITSTQHPDYIQNTGNYTKVYNNDFINIGDSAFDQDSSYFNTAPHDIWIYNNTFRIVDAIDPYPNFIRMYNCNETLKNVKFMNNLFLDGGTGAVYVSINCGSSTTGSGIEIKNNIWYNTGLSQYSPALRIAGSSFTDASFVFANNIYYGGAYVNYKGTSYTASNWIASYESSNSTTLQPTFVSYSQKYLNNDLHLADSDTVAKDQGESLSSYFTIDKDGTTRSGSWEIGPYDSASQETSLTAPPLTLGTVLAD